MADQVTLEQVEAMAARLSPEDRARLMARLTAGRTFFGHAPRTDWMSLRAIAPGLLGGEDAQHWVSRTRGEADLGREKVWKPCP